jgi:hypothetical protein
MIPLLLAAALTAAAPDVRVDGCTVDRAVPEHWEFGDLFETQVLVYATPPDVEVRFANIGGATIGSVRFALVEDGIAVAEVEAAGRFSPGVAIRKTIVLPAATILSEPVSCVPLAVTRDDGSIWRNPSPPRALSAPAGA